MIPALAGRPRPLRIGHMGAAGLAPANSLAAIEAALRIGVDLVELDVWRSADGHLVLSHFDWIRPYHQIQGARLAGGRRWLRAARTWRRWPRVTRSTLAELRALTAPPASLEEALDLMRGRAIPYLDLRGSGWADQLCAALRTHAPDGALLGSGPQRSFHDELALMPGLAATSGVTFPLFGRALAPGTIAALTRAAVRRARRNGAGGLAVGYPLVRQALLEVCREEGFFVFAWTVDDPHVMRRLIALGVDGITTNRPDHLAALLRSPSPDVDAP